MYLNYWESIQSLNDLKNLSLEQTTYTGIVENHTYHNCELTYNTVTRNKWTHPVSPLDDMHSNWELLYVQITHKCFKTVHLKKNERVTTEW